MTSKNQSNSFNKAMLILAWVLIGVGIIGAIIYTVYTKKYQTTNDAQIDQYITPRE